MFCLFRNKLAGEFMNIAINNIGLPQNVNQRPDYQTLRLAAKNLVINGRPEALDLFFRQNTDELTQRLLIDSVKEHGSTAHAERLVPVVGRLDKGISWFLKSNLIRAIGAKGSPELVEKLKPLLESDNEHVQTAALQIIGRIGKPEHVDLVIPHLNSKSEMVKESAIEALGRLGDESHIELILKDLNFGSEFVHSAVNALTELGNSKHIELLPKPQDSAFNTFLNRAVRTLKAKI